MKSRLQLARTLGFAMALGAFADVHAQDPAQPDPAFISSDARLKAQPFDLSDIRITGGTWQTNEDLDKRYILSLDPGRLLHMFRVTAGLPSNAKPLDGWEAPTCGLRGHFTGHYLSACAEMYAATGDKQCKDRGTYVVAELAKCQDAMGTGYLSAFPATAFDTLETQYHGVWAPYYTIHKIMAGLLDQYHYCGNEQALKVAEKMAGYFRARVSKLTPDQVEHMLHTVGHGPQNEFGGMSEVLHNLYAITKKPEYLEFAGVFDRPGFLNPLSMQQDELKDLHANTHIPQVIGCARHYEITGDDKDERAANYFWSQVTAHHSYANGSNSLSEHFQAPNLEATKLGLGTSETCNVYNMLKLSEHIFCWNADPAVADYYELALYNHILGSIEPGTGMTTYFVPMSSGHFKIYGAPESFWCCNGTGMENHAKYGAAIYFHHADTLWVNLFIPSRLTWRDQGLTITQATDFPQSDQTALTITASQPTAAKILLRIPIWAAGASVKINGQVQDTPAAPGSYATLDRTWQSGDKIELTLPMALHLHRAADNPNMVAIFYGPLLLAGDLDVMKNNTFFNLPDPPAPALNGDEKNLASWIKPVEGEPLTFRIQNAAQSSDITLKPFFQFSRDRYALYWSLTDASSPSP